MIRPNCAPLLLLVVTAGFFGSAAPVEGAEPPLVPVGKTVKGTIAPAGASATFRLEAIEGMKLSLVATGKKPLVPRLELIEVATGTVLATKTATAKKRVAALKNVAVPASGQYRVRVSGTTAGEVGKFTVTSALKVKKQLLKPALAASEPPGSVLVFEALAGMRVSGTVALAGSSPGGPDWFHLQGPLEPVLLGDKVHYGASFASAAIAGLPLPASGTYVLAAVDPLLDLHAALELKRSKPKGSVVISADPATAQPAPPLLDAYPPWLSGRGVATVEYVFTGHAAGALRVRAEGPNGAVEADVNGSDQSFAVAVPLSTGLLNPVSFTALPAQGLPSAPTPAGIAVDGAGPTLNVLCPSDGATTSSATISVAGTVGDVLTGAAGLGVTVAGVATQAATVDLGVGTDGTFLATAVPLALGVETVLQITATDAAGNETERQLRVTRVAAPAGSVVLEELGGGGQSGAVGALLAEPLQVRVGYQGGAPVAGKLVLFRVTRGNGVLEQVPDDPNAAAELAVATDGSGVATAWFRLGSTAGAGSHQVEATAVDALGAAWFCESARPGAPRAIHVAAGNRQVGQAGAPLALPLAVRVTDGENPVEGVAVTYSVASGDGSFSGQPSATVATDATGRAEVPFALGPKAGLQRVTARFLDQPGLPTVFTAEALAPDGLVGTQFSGVVLDNVAAPIPGARCILSLGGAEYEAETGADGRFTCAGLAAAGVADLHVHPVQLVDVPGLPKPVPLFPSMHLTGIAIVPNAENHLPDPVFLPALDPQSWRVYDGTADVELTSLGIEGLRFVIAAGSMVRADGSVPSPADPECVAVNQVHFDKIPMPLPDGRTTAFAWTLQPSGSRFDPPVRIEIPNMEGLAPGTVTSIQSFDHDTGRFEVACSAVVAADGSLIRSDPGTGLAVAGWGAPPPPPKPTGKVANCAGLDVAGLLESLPGLGGELLGLIPGVVETYQCGKSAYDGTGAVIAGYEEWVNGGSGLVLLLKFANAAKTVAVKCAEAVAAFTPEPTSKIDKVLQVAGLLDEALAVVKSQSECLDPHVAEVLSVLAKLTGLASKIGDAKEAVEGTGLASGVLCYGLELTIDVLTEQPAGFGQALGIAVDQVTADASALLQQAMAAKDSLGFGFAADVAAMQGGAAGVADALASDPELAGCTVAVGSQSTIAGDNGGWSIDNVPACPNPVAAIVTCETPAGTLYASSPFFVVGPNEWEIVAGPFTFGPDPPEPPQSIYFSLQSLAAVPSGPPERSVSTLEPGQGLQLHVIARLGSDGTAFGEVTTLAEGTVYATSNAAIASISAAGALLAVKPGLAYVTATNQGVSTVKKVIVAATTIQTTLVGVVHGPGGAPVAGAQVSTSLGGAATSAALGAFQLPLVLPPETESLQVKALAQIGGKAYSASKVVVDPNGGGLTDAGILALQPVLCLAAPAWASLGSGITDVSGTVRALAVYPRAPGQPDALYVAGKFASAGNVPGTSDIAMWDGSQWHSVGGGITGLSGHQVYDLAVYDDALGGGPQLYAAGQFTTAGGVAVPGIARWNGAIWSALPGGTPSGYFGGVFSGKLAVHDDGTAGKPLLCASGYWWVARYTGAAWSTSNLQYWSMAPLQPFLNPVANQTLLYGGGDHYNSGAPTADHFGLFASWNGGSWGLDSGAFVKNSVLQSFAVFDDGGGSGPRLYAGGAGQLVNSVPASLGIAAFSGTQWEALGAGVAGSVTALAVHDESDGAGARLIVGGSFSIPGVANASNIARWNGVAFTPLGTGVNGVIYDAATFHDGSSSPAALYVAGGFTAAGGQPASRIARWGCVNP